MRIATLHLMLVRIGNNNQSHLKLDGTLPSDSVSGSDGLNGEAQVHQNHFHQKKFFIKNHLHQKPLTSKTTYIKNHSHQTTFIKNHFHQKPLSSKTNFIKNQFHQKPISSEHFLSEGPTTRAKTIQCLCESVAARRPSTPSHKHGLCPPLGSQLAFLLNRQCSAERPAEGPKVGVHVLGFRV